MLRLVDVENLKQTKITDLKVLIQHIKAKRRTTVTQSIQKAGINFPLFTNYFFI